MSEWETAGRKTRTTTRTAPRPAVKPDQVLNQARRQGIPVETQQKYGGGSNKQQAGAKNTAKLDRETEELKHDQVPLELGKLIMRARQEKGMSQKDLATKICEKPQVVNDYEAGRGIPNNAIIAKIERALAVKLRGKDKGHVLPTATPTAKK